MASFPELLARSLDGIFVLDASQTIVFWNPACERMTGIPAETALGRSCHDVIQGRDPSGRALCRSHCPVGQLVKGGPPPSQLNMRITHQDGQSLQLSVGTLLMPSDTGNEWNVVHVMRRSREAKRTNLFACDAGAEPAEAPANGSSHAAMLTSREREVLRLLARGLGVDAIAAETHISLATARNHIQRMMAKLDVHSRHEAVAYAHRHHLL